MARSARRAGMGFSIDYDFGVIGGIVIVLLISAGAIVLTFLVTSANRARHDVIDDDPDAPIL